MFLLWDFILAITSDGIATLGQKTATSISICFFPLFYYFTIIVSVTIYFYSTIKSNKVDQSNLQVI